MLYSLSYRAAGTTMKMRGIYLELEHFGIEKIVGTYRQESRRVGIAQR